MLCNLRKLVLGELHALTPWGLLWDLGSHSTFLDIGSGYGKACNPMRWRLQPYFMEAVTLCGGGCDPM